MAGIEKILRDNRSLCVAMGRKHKHNNRGDTGRNEKRNHYAKG